MAGHAEAKGAQVSHGAKSEGESKFTVVAALAANLAIAIGKLFAGLISGSAALLAEAGHSFADTVNQVFLLIGINLSHAQADEKHPLGYGKEAFFWSFLAAIFIFVAGATFSFYEGIRTAVEQHVHDRSSTELGVAYGVLVMATLFELSSFVVAVRGLRSGARRRGWSILRFIREAPEVTIKTVFFEDSAALLGLQIAITGLTMSEITGSENWDAAASISIGVVLAGVAVMLGSQSRSLLLGAAASPETRERLREIVHSFSEVVDMPRMLSMQLGANSVLVTGELYVRRGMTTDEIEGLIVRIDEKIGEELPEVSETFWELHGNEKIGELGKPGNQA
jgi:cation diffusion facilitator family transporter